MGDRRLLLVAFFLVAGSTRVQSQINLDSIKNSLNNAAQSASNWGKGVGQDISSWGSGVGQDISSWGSGVRTDIRNWGRNVMNQINGFKDKAMGTYSSRIPADVKRWIDSGNFTNANITSLLSIPKNAWNAMKLEKLMAMGRDNLTALVNQGANKIPERIIDELNRLMTTNKTKDEVLIALKSQNCRMGEMGNGCTLSKSTLMAYLNRLGNPQTFTNDNITSFSTALYNFPIRYLQMINDTNAIQSIIPKLQPCYTDPNPPVFCPMRRTAQVAVKILAQNAFGDPSIWTLANVQLLGGYSKISVDDIAKLNNQTLRSIKSDLTRAQFSADDSTILMEALNAAEGVMSMGVPDVIIWLNSLGNLKAYVLADDVPPQALNDPIINTTVTSNMNAMASKGTLPKMMSKMALRTLLQGNSPGKMTQADVNAAGMLLADASPNVLQMLIDRGVLSGNTLTTLTNNFEDSGPGSMAKGRLLLNASLNTANSRSIPTSMVRFQSVASIKRMSANDIRTFFRNADADSLQLDDGQKAAMLAVLAAAGPVDYTKIPPSLKSAVPLSSINGASQLQDLGSGMPANFPANLKTSSNIFTSQRNVTLQTVQQNMQFLPIMTSFDASRINEQDIGDILTSFNSATDPPSMDVCRNLKNKMIQFAMTELDPDNPTEVAQMMTISEVENTPPCVLGALGKDAYASLRPDTKTIIMQNMGNSDNSLSIPRAIRQFIIQEGMRPMGNMDVIRGDLLIELNTSIADLTGTQIRKIDPSEISNFLRNMAMAFGSPKKPCMDTDQRAAIADLMVKLSGPISGWEDATDYCCLLEVLSSSQLSSMQPDVLSSCTCPSSTDGFEDYIDARNNLCKSDIGEDQFNRNMQAMDIVKQKQIEAAVSSMNTIQSSKRRKRATSADTCAMASIGGAAVLSTTDINSLDNNTIQTCMSSLTQFDMENNMARTVFVRFMLANNNNLSSLTIPKLLTIQWAWAGLMATDVQNLPNLVYPDHNDVVGDMGKYRLYDQGVLGSLANTVLTEWKSANQLTSSDLNILRQLICGFNTSSVQVIQNSQIRPAITTLNNLQNCPAEVTRALAAQAITAYGGAATLDASSVNEMGNLMGGLIPEVLMAIPSQSFAGMASKGIASIPPESIKALKVDQIKNLPATAALSLSVNQKAQFNSEMLEALQDVLEGNSGVVNMPTTLIVCLMMTSLLLFK